MKVCDEELRLMARTYPSDALAATEMAMAQELLAARLVIEAARRVLAGGPQEPLEDALAAYDEAVR